MLTKESIYVILFSLPVYQLLFYTIQLISFKRKNPSKKYLGLLLLSMTTFLVINALHFLGYYRLFTYLYLIYLPVLLSIAPAYFLYILSITRENHDVKGRQRLVLFLPALIIFILNIIVIFSMEETARMSLFDRNMTGRGTNGDEDIPGVLIGFWIAAIVLVFGQLSFAIAKVAKIMQSEAELMRQQPSYLAYLEWRWILGISVGVLVFLVINALIEMALPMNLMGVVLVYNLLMLISGGVTGYMGMKQDDLLNQVEKVNVPGADLNPELQEYVTPEKTENVAAVFITGAEAEEIQHRIIEYLEKDKPYIQSSFSMHDLCSHLNVNRRKVSYVLNEVIQKNFYGIVNEYRIREAEKLLMKDDIYQMKIEVLGEMVGFQSKSSFNACFKKVTGMTPSEYRLKKKSV
jgi:AraC-like DNA-binding protein